MKMKRFIWIGVLVVVVGVASWLIFQSVSHQDKKQTIQTNFSTGEESVVKYSGNNSSLKEKEKTGGMNLGIIDFNPKNSK